MSCSSGSSNTKFKGEGGGAGKSHHRGTKPRLKFSTSLFLVGVTDSSSTEVKPGYVYLQYLLWFYLVFKVHIFDTGHSLDCPTSGWSAEAVPCSLGQQVPFPADVRAVSARCFLRLEGEKSLTSGKNDFYKET